MNTTKTETQLGTVYDFTEGNFEDKKFFFALTDANAHSSYIDKVTKKPVKVFPNNFSLQMEVSVFDRNFVDPKTKRKSPKKRIMRYVQGESIWKDEQINDRERDTPLPKEYIDFIDGRRLLDGTETAFLQFMMNDDRNESKPGRDTKVTAVYRLVEVGAELKKEIEKEMELNNLRQWCFGAGEYKENWHEVAAYARGLNVSLNRDAAEVRFRMSQLATAKPKQFLAGMNNPAMVRKHYIHVAIDAGVLTKDDNMNSLLWTSNGGLLIAAQAGIDPIDFFVDHSFTPKGEEAYNTVLAKAGIKQKKNASASSEEKTIKTSGITIPRAEKMLEEAEARSVITRKGTSTFVYNMDQEDERKFVGRSPLVGALVEEPEFLKKVHAQMADFDITLKN